MACIYFIYLISPPLTLFSSILSRFSLFNFNFLCFIISQYVLFHVILIIVSFLPFISPKSALFQLNVAFKPSLYPVFCVYRAYFIVYQYYSLYIECIMNERSYQQGSLHRTPLFQPLLCSYYHCIQFMVSITLFIHYIHCMYSV